MDLPELSSVERAVVTAPDVIARAAARTVDDPAQQWLLRQPRAVRCSFVEHVLDGPRTPDAAERWMLLQRDSVRRSYVAEVLDRGSP